MKWKWQKNRNSTKYSNKFWSSRANIYEDTLREMSDKGLNDAVESFPEFSCLKHLLYSDTNKEAGVSKLQSKIRPEIEISKKFKNFILAVYSILRTSNYIFFAAPRILLHST